MFELVVCVFCGRELKSDIDCSYMVCAGCRSYEGI